jgi:hypothetical protein
MTGLCPEKKLEVKSVRKSVSFFSLVEEKETEKKKKRNIYGMKVFFLFVRNNLALTKESHLEKRGEVKIKGTYLLL